VPNTRCSIERNFVRNISLKFSAENGHDDHEADEAEQRHDDVEEGVVSLVEPVEDEQHVEINEAVHLGQMLIDFLWL
jgi:hypothetical protein